MALLQGLFFLALGVFILAVDGHALRRGSVTLWRYGFGAHTEYSRARQPLQFWCVFGLYAVAGLWMAVFALRVLLGNAAPLPMH